MSHSGSSSSIKCSMPLIRYDKEIKLCFQLHRISCKPVSTFRRYQAEAYK